MILSPLPCTKNLLGQWVPPVITQHFSENPDAYKKFGIEGHNGLDLRAKTPLRIYAPFEGTCTVENKGAYGLHIIIQNERLKTILAHLSSVEVQTGTVVKLGEPIGMTGNSGNSLAPHLHQSLIPMNGSVPKHSKNGYNGCVDFEPFLIYWIPYIS